VTIPSITHALSHPNSSARRAKVLICEIAESSSTNCGMAIPKVVEFRPISRSPLTWHVYPRRARRQRAARIRTGSADSLRDPRGRAKNPSPSGSTRSEPPNPTAQRASRSEACRRRHSVGAGVACAECAGLSRDRRVDWDPTRCASCGYDRAAEFRPFVRVGMR